MRILFLNPGGILGGAERSMLDLASSLRRHAPELELGLIVGGEGPLADRARRLGMDVTMLPYSPRLAEVGDTALIGKGLAKWIALGPRLARGGASASAYVWRLAAAIRRFRPSIIHSNGFKMHLLAAAARTRAPLVWHLRDFVGERPLVSRAMRVCMSRVDAGIAISHAVAASALRVLPGLDMTVIHNAIDTETFSPDGPRLDLDSLAGAPPAPANTVRVGLVATYAIWKGHDIFLRAAARIARESAAPARFYVIGSPIYQTPASQFREEDLRAMTASLGLGDRVAFVPFQHQIEEAYRSLDVVVHASSRPEPFGRTIVEAMATGRAVVVAREGGATELFTEGADAVGVPARDPDALADALRPLLENAERRARLGVAARETAVAKFSRGRLAGEALAVYRRLLAP